MSRRYKAGFALQRRFAGRRNRRRPAADSKLKLALAVAVTTIEIPKLPDFNLGQMSEGINPALSAVKVVE